MPSFSFEAVMIIEEMTSEEFSHGLNKTQTVLIPVGATEGHGKCLPLGTDSFQAIDVCCRLADKRDVFVAPLVSYGVCRSTQNHPGTVSLRTETLKQLVIDIVTSLYSQGLRNFVVLSGHAGGTHNATLLDAGEGLLQALPKASIAVVTEYDLAYEKGKDLIETRDDSHAGEIEMSRMMATRPHLVKGTAAADRPSFPEHILVRNKFSYWESGVWGDPGKADAQKGAAIEAAVIEALDQLVTELEAFSEVQL